MTRKYIAANLSMCELNLATVNTSIAQINDTKFVEFRQEKLTWLQTLKDNILTRIEELKNTTPTD